MAPDDRITACICRRRSRIWGAGGRARGSRRGRAADRSCGGSSRSRHLRAPWWEFAVRSRRGRVAPPSRTRRARLWPVHRQRCACGAAADRPERGDDARRAPLRDAASLDRGSDLATRLRPSIDQCAGFWLLAEGRLAGLMGAGRLRLGRERAGRVDLALWRGPSGRCLYSWLGVRAGADRHRGAVRSAAPDDRLPQACLLAYTLARLAPITRPSQARPQSELARGRCRARAARITTAGDRAAGGRHEGRLSCSSARGRRPPLPAGPRLRRARRRGLGAPPRPTTEIRGTPLGRPRRAPPAVSSPDDCAQATRGLARPLAPDARLREAVATAPLAVDDYAGPSNYHLVDIGRPPSGVVYPRGSQSGGRGASRTEALAHVLCIATGGLGSMSVELIYDPRGWSKVEGVDPSSGAARRNHVYPMATRLPSAAERRTAPTGGGDISPR